MADVKAKITIGMVQFTANAPDELQIGCTLEASPGDEVGVITQPLSGLIVQQAVDSYQDEGIDEVCACVSEELIALRKTCAKLEQWLANTAQKGSPDSTP